MDRERLKSMPYRIEEGELERLKIASRAAVARASAERTPHFVWRLALPAAALGAIAIAVVCCVAFFTPSHYDTLIDQLADAPEEVLYEITADVVEYQDDITLL